MLTKRGINMNYVTSRIDKDGNEIRHGDIIVEGSKDELFWDGKARIIIPPIGIAISYDKSLSTPSKLFEPEKSSYYNVIQIMAGKAQLTDKADKWMKEQFGENDNCFSLHLSKYDGAFEGWKSCKIIGNIFRMIGNYD